MYLKGSTASIFSCVLVSTVCASAVTNYASSVDPTKINIPNIPQTTSDDPNTECTWYASEYTFDRAAWPTIWMTATSNGMTTTPEFKALNSSIDWTKVPDIQPRKLGSTGTLNMSAYNVAEDPDCWWSASQCVTPKRSDVYPDVYACNEPETLGLTFDDGPNCSHNAFYDYLEENKQKASMFYIGSNVLSWPYGALRGVKDGHHIAGHTWSHQLMTTLTNEEILAELYYTVKAIKYVTGLTPLYWRPAQGDLDDRVRWIATQLNLTAILWNIDTDDWAANVIAGVTTQTVEQNYQDFITMGKNGTFSQSGAIMLSHEINNMTMSFAIAHYPDLKKAYTNVLDVATCANISFPYVEKSVSFPTFKQFVSGSPAGGNKKKASMSNTSQKASEMSGASAKTNVNGLLSIAALIALVTLI
ncbi:chitin deacetylase 1 [Dichotomocladium elegans]|nr:chitin deacetylase 1 [Dichotomocladium elegans]